MTKNLQRPRIAFVVQRYGTEVSGGAETHCRLVVEKLAATFEIEILTTCAQDYITWANAYPPGLTNVNGIPVQRFPTVTTRSTDFGEQSAKLFSRPHTLQDEIDWIQNQGPYAPGLLEYIARNRFRYAAMVFVGYLYYPTVFGARLAPERTLLMPTAHDEPPIYLKLFESLFRTPRALIYNTPEEKAIVEALFGIDHIPNGVAGIGIDMPSEIDPIAFSQKYGIDSPYVVYVGRVSRSKNCHELLDYFIRYKAAYPNDSLKLILIGETEPVLPIPVHKDILSLGFISEEDKNNAITGSQFLLMPSKFESLSIVMLECMGMGVPVLCDGSSDVLRGHCLRSNGALFYENYEEFALSLTCLQYDQTLRKGLGENGRRYVAESYTWSHVTNTYSQLINEVIENSWLENGNS